MRTMIASLILIVASTGAFAGDCSDGTSIKDAALATPALSTLVAAAVKTDLVDFLDSNRDLTVFAPTNDAFDATARIVLEDENATGIDLVNALPEQMLEGILLYHIASGERFSDDVLGARKVRMLSKEFTYPSIMSGAPFINDSEIVIPDIDVCNGVVHVIGTGVLLPE